MTLPRLLSRASRTAIALALAALPGALFVRGVLAQPRRSLASPADAGVRASPEDAASHATPLASTDAGAAPSCPEGLAPVDAEGHCCVPGQRWQAARCAGVPTGCAPGQVPAATDAGVRCVPRPCEPGRERAADGVHCCWPGQTFRARDNACRAERPEQVRCPDDTTVLERGDCAPRVGVAHPSPPRGAPRPAGMVWVGGGTFRMGGPNAARYVSVGPYWIDRTEVTAAAYARCVAARRCPAAGDPFGVARAAGAPAVNVTHEMAQAYCGQAGGRLPTEAEWEFAARGADGRTYPWGDRTPDCTLARFAGCEQGAAPVGSLRAGASPFGALEMAGNVAEWTADRASGGGAGGAGAASAMAAGSVRDPTGPAEASGARAALRIVRGGAFDSSPGALRATARVERDGREARYDTGFRCVRSGPESATPAHGSDRGRRARGSGPAP